MKGWKNRNQTRNTEQYESYRHGLSAKGIRNSHLGMGKLQRVSTNGSTPNFDKLAGVRRMGIPRTDEERKQRHKQLYGDKPPEQRLGLGGRKSIGWGKIEMPVEMVNWFKRGIKDYEDADKFQKRFGMTPNYARLAYKHPKGRKVKQTVIPDKVMKELIKDPKWVKAQNILREKQGLKSLKLKGRTGKLELLAKANPMLFRRAKNSKNVEEFINAVIKTDKTTRKNVSIPVLTDFYIKVNKGRKSKTYNPFERQEAEQKKFSKISLAEAKNIVGNVDVTDLKAMKKALSMFPVLNTTEENQRLEAVKIVLKTKKQSGRMDETKQMTELEILQAQRKDLETQAGVRTEIEAEKQRIKQAKIDIEKGTFKAKVKEKAPIYAKKLIKGVSKEFKLAFGTGKKPISKNKK